MNSKDRVGIHSRNISVASDMHNTGVKQQNIIIDKNKIITEAKEIVKNKTEKANKDTSLAEDTSDTVSKSDQNSIDGSIEKKSLTEKKIFQPRKPFLPKVRERKTAIPNANAFSPENESSVYAFESDTEVPVSTPFRRKIRDDAKSSTAITPTAATVSQTKVIAEVNKSSLKKDSEPPDSKEKSSNDITTSVKKEQETQESMNVANMAPSVNKFELPKNFASLTSVQVLPLDKLTTSWSNVNCSASIAVQVNLDETMQEQESDTNQQKSTEISTQTETSNENDDDNDGQLFYIPLQAVRSGPNLVQGQQLIQGVAVKLGTEGPTGPNQRVLLRAKLVTKPPLSMAHRCPPIGTVQPTTRIPPNPVAITVEQQVPLTSTTATVSTTIANMPNAETQPMLLAKSEVSVPSLNRPNVSTNANSSLEKLTKSPKSSRERKASIDSTKSGKR